MNLYEKFIQSIKPAWEITEPFPSYKDRDENSFRVLHLTQSEFEFMKSFLRDHLMQLEYEVKFYNLPAYRKQKQSAKKYKKTLSEIQRKLKNESRP